MAKQVKGILYGITGKLGDKVYSYWRGIPVVRKAPGKSKGPPTVNQQIQQERFKILVQFLRPLTGLFEVGFEHYAKGMTCFNKAMSENRDIIVGSYPDFRINYARLALSGDQAFSYEEPTTTSILPGIVRYSWFDDRGRIKRRIPALLFVAAYCPELNRWIYDLYPGRERDGNCDLSLASFSKHTVHTYIGFIRDFGRPRSCYTGPVDIL